MSVSSHACFLFILFAAAEGARYLLTLTHRIILEELSVVGADVTRSLELEQLDVGTKLRAVSFSLTRLEEDCVCFGEVGCSFSKRVPGSAPSYLKC